MSAHKQKIIILAGIIVLGIIVIGVLLYARGVRLRNPVQLLPEPQQAINGAHERSAESIDSNVTLDSLQEVSGGNATNAVNHQNALYLYRGQVVQFNDNCRANPVIMTLPTKSVVMLDNPSKWQRNIIVGPRTYLIQPYDYVLASFNETGQYGITCDSVQDVGIVSIQ